MESHGNQDSIQTTDNINKGGVILGRTFVPEEFAEAEDSMMGSCEQQPKDSIQTTENINKGMANFLDLRPASASPEESAEVEDSR